MRRASRAHAEEFQSMRDGPETAAAGDLFLPLARETFIDFYNLGATAANQVVVMTVFAGAHQFVTGHTVAKIKSFNHADVLQQVQRAINRGQVAIALGKTRENLLVAQRMAMSAEHIQDGLPRTGDFPRFLSQAIGQFRQFGRWNGSVYHNYFDLSQQDAGKAKGRPNADRDELLALNAMAFFGFEQNGGRNVHKNSNHHSHQFARMLRQHAMPADQQSQRRHRGENAQPAQCFAPAQAGMKEDSQKRDGHRIVMKHDAPEQQTPAG